MRIQNKNDGSRAITVRKFGTRVEFSKNGYATVTDEVGRYLVRTVPDISECSAKKPKAAAKEAVNAPEEATD